MRKQYAICNYQSDIYRYIDKFFSTPQIASLYTLIDYQYDRIVYHNNQENLDLVFYTPQDMIYEPKSEYRLCLLVTTQYDQNIDPFFLPDVVCNGIKQFQFYDVENAIYYFPAPTLLCQHSGYNSSQSVYCPEDKLVINFNSENSTFMITLVRNYLLDYTYTKAIAHRTSSICFGTVEKSLNFEGGFFYGGDFMCTYERIFREDASGVSAGNYTYCVYDSSFNSVGFHRMSGADFISNPYSLYSVLNSGGTGWSVPNPNNVNRFDAILRANIDYAPMRKRDDKLEVSNFVNPPPSIIRNQTWAVTMDLDYYVPMVCSITNSEKKLPRYTSLLSEDYLHKGRALNTSNKMSPVMPLWFMVRRDPQELGEYSYIGKNKVINYVNMRYMDTDVVVESSFPSQEEVNKYNCFQMGSRRAFFGMKGYSGLAFKMEDTVYDPDDPSTYPDWMIYPQELDTCDVVWQNDGKVGYHFHPDESEARNADFVLFVFRFNNLGVVYIKPDYAKMINAIDNNIDYDAFADAVVYVSWGSTLPQPPIMPQSAAWVSISTVPLLALMQYHLRDYADIDHMMFSGNAQFDADFVEGEIYLCNN